MTPRKSRWILAGLTVAVLALVAAAAWAAGHLGGRHSSNSSTASASTSTTPTPSETPLVLSRGQQVATLPPVCQETDAATVACEYVIADASPDSRLDKSALGTWRRTGRFTTPEMFNRNKGIHEPTGGEPWTTLRKSDGWIEPVIDNVLGDDRQAPGTKPSAAASAGQQFTVIYHRKLHSNGTDVTTDTAVRQTTVTMTGGTKPLVSSATPN